MSETSVERALAIFETFEQERRPLSLKELAEQCRMPPSTCHSLAHTLLRRGYLYQAGRRKDVYPTRRLYDIGKTIAAHDPVLQRLLPVMEELRDATRETVILGKRQKDAIIYLEVLESPEVIRYSARAGDAKPLASTCIGKAMLAQLDDAELREWLREHPPKKITKNTIVQAGALLQDLALGRATGVFTTRGENVADVTALAIPVRMGSETLAIAVAGPSHRVEPHHEAIAKQLKDARDCLAEPEAAIHG